MSTFEEEYINLCLKNGMLNELEDREIPSYLACKYGDRYGENFILKHIDPNTELDYGCRYGQVEVVRFLLSCGKKFVEAHVADVCRGRSLEIFKMFEKATHVDYDYVLKLCAEHKADDIFSYIMGERYLRFDVKYATTPLIYSLSTASNSVDKFYQAVYFNDLETIKKMVTLLSSEYLKYGLNISVRENNVEAFRVILEEVKTCGSAKLYESIFESFKINNVGIFLELNRL